MLQNKKYRVDFTRFDTHRKRGEGSIGGMNIPYVIRPSSKDMKTIA